MAIETNELIDVKSLPPFKKFIMTIGNLPTSYLESMTYGEMLMWFCNYLQETVIPTVNNNALAVEELQELYIELKNYVDNYFDNLDIQQEVNRKLDDMAENGTLTDLITRYLNPYIESQDILIAEINNKVNSVASGSPAGVYATSTDLETADPDHTKIYLVQADGNWYYYDTTNSEWVAGGLYQTAQTITDVSLTNENLGANSKIVGANLNNVYKNIGYISNLNTDLIWELGNIYGTTGAEVDSTTKIRTDEYYYATKGDVIYSDDGYLFAIRKFNSPFQIDYILPELNYVSYYEFDENCYFRIVARTNPETTITTVSDVSDHIYFNLSNLEFNHIFNNVNFEFESGIYVASSQTIVSNANNNHVAIPVQEDEIYKIYNTYLSTSYMISFLDEDDTYISSRCPAGLTNATIYVTIPENATTMIINHKKDSTLTLHKLDGINETITNLNVNYNDNYDITIATNNMGMFRYGIPSITPETYLKNWKQMINDTKFDVFGLCEWADNYETLNTQEVMFDPLVISDNKEGHKKFESKYQSLLNYSLPLSTGFTALVNKIRVHDKDIYIYVVYCMYSEGNEEIRQTEYQAIIDDISNNNYEYAIIVGDFNAQVTSEYDIFKNNGFTICNGGYLGDFATLRDITADNIIFTNNIKLKEFKMLEYTLNTDHKPIVATLTIM